MLGRLAIAAAVLVGPAAWSNTGAGDDLCAALGAPKGAGTVAEPALTEISGLAASRVHPGVLWTHNDSGGRPEVFAMAEDGTDLGAYDVDGAGATDWEDIAAGPGPDPDRSYLYAADIGDNDAVRTSVTVYRAPEPDTAPDGAGGTLRGTEAIELHYPDGPADAEALLVDPVTGTLVIVTKSYAGRSHVLEAPASVLVDDAPVTMTDVGTITIRPPLAGVGLPGTAVTGGDVSPDGSIVLLRTYRSVLAFSRVDGQSVADALQGASCEAPQPDEPQGEAVAFASAGDAYLTVSEGSSPPIHRVALAVPAATTVPPTTTATTTGGGDGDDGDGGTSATVVLAVGAIAAAAAVGLVLVARRRRRRPG
jgi:hypothetical protein